MPLDAFHTTNMKLAAALITCERDSFLRAERIGNRLHFYFNDPKMQKIRAAEYENATLSVDARTVFEAYEDLRDIKNNP